MDGQIVLIIIDESADDYRREIVNLKIGFVQKW